MIMLPFVAGVSVLLYTDRRIRAEDFDVVLRTGAAGRPDVGGSIDNLWLTQPTGKDPRGAHRRRRPRSRPPVSAVGAYGKVAEHRGQ